MIFDAPDWCHATGIPFDRSTLEPDDPITDHACTVRGQLDGIAVHIKRWGRAG